MNTPLSNRPGNVTQDASIDVAIVGSKLSTRSKSLRLIRSTIGQLGWRYWVFVVACICLASISLLPPELFRYFTVQLQNSQPNQLLMNNLMVFGGLIAVAMFISTFGSILMREWLRLNVQANLRRNVLAILHNMPFESLDEAERGEWMTKMTGDLANVENFITESIPEQLRDITILTGVAVLFSYHVGEIALIPISTALVIAVANYFIQIRLAPVLQKLRSLNGSVFQSLIENFEGKKTIRTQFGEQFAQQKFESKIQMILSSGMSVVRVIGALMGSNQLASQVMVTTILTVVTWAILSGQFSLNLAEALVIPFYIGMFFGAAQGLASEGYSWNRYFAEGGRLADIMIEPRFLQKRDTSKDEIAKTAQTISAINLTVGFLPNTVICGPLSFRLNQGKMTVFLGASGCGKSTSLEILAGLRAPLQGNLALEDKNGTIVWQSASKRDLLPRTAGAYVEQHPYVFAGSLKENMTFGLSDMPTEEQIWDAIDQVGLTEFARRGEGLIQRIFDRGENISEGQRYRIAIVRALLTKRPFILLDEPFAAIDKATVERVVKTLNELKQDRGIVIVTHYLPPALAYDEIFNFDSARVEAEKNRENETGKKSGFANLPRLEHIPSANDGAVVRV